MLLGNLFHDGETESRALGARRHIRLGETMTFSFRQTDAIVDDVNARHRPIGFEPDGDAA